MAMSIKSITVSLTSSQLFRPHSAPTIIVPAPGVGKIICIVSAYLELLVGAVVFDGQSASLYYDDSTFTSANDVLNGSAGGFPNSDVSSVIILPGLLTVVNRVLIENKAIVLAGPPDADSTTGDGTGKVTVFYYIHPVAI